MTQHYTLEQAERFANELGLVWGRRFGEDYDSTNISIHAFQAALNLAINQRIGEPVGYIDRLSGGTAIGKNIVPEPIIGADIYALRKSQMSDIDQEYIDWRNRQATRPTSPEDIWKDGYRAAQLRKARKGGEAVADTSSDEFLHKYGEFANSLGVNTFTSYKLKAWLEQSTPPTTKAAVREALEKVKKALAPFLVGVSVREQPLFIADAEKCADEFIRALIEQEASHD